MDSLYVTLLIQTPRLMFGSRYRSIPCRSWHHTLGAGMPHPNFLVSTHYGWACDDRNVYPAHAVS